MWFAPHGRGVRRKLTFHALEQWAFNVSNGFAGCLRSQVYQFASLAAGPLLQPEENVCETRRNVLPKWFNLFQATSEGGFAELRDDFEGCLEGHALPS